MENRKNNLKIKITNKNILKKGFTKVLTFWHKGLFNSLKEMILNVDSYMFIKSFFVVEEIP
jgi:hypothetical protein